MRTLQEAYEAVEAYSPAEERLNRRRRTAGLVLGPLAFLTVLVCPVPIPGPAHRMAAIMTLVVVLWVTEALPMAVTALLGPVLAVVLQVAPAPQAFASFADPVIFLFIGSLILAEAVFMHGLDRRIAFTALAWRRTGSSATRLLVVYGGVSTVLSMWMSNTATTAMMFPIGLSVIAHLARAGGGATPRWRRFAAGMMLMTSFGASVGGLATPVGTPPNLIGIGFIDRLEHVHLDFARWMALGVPLAAILFGFLCVLFWWTCAHGIAIGEDGVALARDELRRLGPLSAGQRNTLIALGAAVLLWVAPGLAAAAGLVMGGVADSALVRGYRASVPEGVAAMLGAILLFVLPVDWKARRFTLSWREAAQIDWGVVLLYGGGLALGDLLFSTGLARATGEAVTAWLPSHGAFALTVLFTGVAILLSETTSNTAAANVIVPIAIAVGEGAGVDPVLPAIGATLGSSLGFMLPVSTAPNAIVYSSGYVPITTMMTYGLALDAFGFVAIVAIVTLLGPLLF
jgi:sodium-dependent dicarboxylate transporter 2/3/5